MSKPKPSGSPHAFLPDVELPPDINGRGVCASCHLVGRPGDTHHALPDVPEQADARHRVDPDDD